MQFIEHETFLFSSALVQVWSMILSNAWSMILSIVYIDRSIMW